MPNPPLTLQDAWQRIWYRRKYVGVAVLISAVLAGFFSSAWFITPKYKASTAFIPPSFSNLKQLNFKENQPVGFGIGGNDDADRCVTILTAKSTQRVVAEKFQWGKKFKILDLQADKRDKILEGMFTTNIDIRTTSSSSVEISVLDTDSTQAALTANFLTNYLDSLLETFSGRKANIAGNKKSLEKLWIGKNNILDSLGLLRKQYRIYHTEIGSESYMKKTLPGMVDSPEAHQVYDDLVSLERRLYIVDGEIAMLERENNRIAVHLQTFPSTLNVYQYADVPRYVSYPQRIFIVLGVCLAVLFTLTIVIAFLDKAPSN